VVGYTFSGFALATILAKIWLFFASIVIAKHRSVVALIESWTQPK
jgi:hypothetical protein